MKNLMLKLFALITLLVTIAFASALASVSAQTPGHNITASIPFEFNVGDKTLPAGHQELAKNREEAATITLIAAIH